MRQKKDFLNVQCRETEINNAIGKTTDHFKKIGDTREHFMQRKETEETKKKWQKIHRKTIQKRS